MNQNVPVEYIYVKFTGLMLVLQISYPKLNDKLYTLLAMMLHIILWMEAYVIYSLLPHLPASIPHRNTNITQNNLFTMDMAEIKVPANPNPLAMLA